MSQETILYRHYDETGGLLYVGISNDLGRRTLTHSRKSEWFRWVAKIEVEYFATRAGALAAEVLAVDEGRPIFNRLLSNEAFDPWAGSRWAVVEDESGYCDGKFVDYLSALQQAVCLRTHWGLPGRVEPVTPTLADRIRDFDYFAWERGRANA